MDEDGADLCGHGAVDEDSQVWDLVFGGEQRQEVEEFLGAFDCE